jgi:hypothetical protein
VDVSTAIQPANVDKMAQLPPQTPPREDGSAVPENNAKAKRKSLDFGHI